MSIVVKQGEGEDEHQNDFDRADMKKALAYWDSQSIGIHLANGVTRPLEKNFDRSVLGTHSLAFQLYFKLIKWLTVFFGMASGLGIYLIYSNASGGGIRSPFDSLTLGNQPDYSNLTNILNIQGYDAWVVQIDSMNIKLMVQQYIDLSISILLFMFFITYRRSSLNEKDWMDSHGSHVSDYAIEIDGIPEKGVSELEVAIHFRELFGSVAQCKFARDYKGTMHHFEEITEIKDHKRRQEAEIQAELSTNTKKLLKYDKRIEEIKKTIADKLTAAFGQKPVAHNDYPAIKAWLIFDTLSAKNQALRTYARFQSIALYRVVFCCKRSTLPQKYKLLGRYNITVKGAEEPGNIYWENLDTELWASTLRKSLVSALVFLCLVATFAFVVFSNVLSYNAQLGAACTKGDPSLSIALQSTSYVNCYCAGLSIDQILQSSQNQSTCSSYLRARSFQMMMTILTGFCILIVNAIIKQIFIALAKFQRFKSLSSESYSTQIRYFLAIFINTAIIPILANSNIGGMQITLGLVEMFVNDPAGIVSTTYPNDFDRSWYSQVGGKIMAPMAIAIVFPQLISLLLVPLKKWIILTKAKGAIFQKDMNEIFTPPDFYISLRYAAVMNILFVSIVFSSGMPLLYITAFLTLITIYFSDKYIVARFCRRPSGYDSCMNDLVIKSIPFALLIHCLIAMWMFGSYTIFPFDPNTVSGSQIEDNNYYFSARFDRSFAHFMLGIIVLLSMMIDYFVWPVFLAFSPQVEKAMQDKIDKKTAGSFKQEIHRLIQLGVANYNIRSNPKYFNITEAMQLNFDDDDDAEGSYLYSTQRVLSNKSNSHSETDQISPEGMSKNQIVIPESPMILKTKSEVPLFNKHLQTVKGNSILPESPLMTKHNQDSPMLHVKKSAKDNQVLPL